MFSIHKAGIGSSMCNVGERCWCNTCFLYKCTSIQVSVALPASTKHGATPGGGGAGVPNYISPTSSIKNYQTPLLSPTLYSPHDPLVRSGSNIYPVPFSASANYNGNIPANLPLGSTPYSPIFQQPPMQNHMAQQVWRRIGLTLFYVILLVYDYIALLC